MAELPPFQTRQYAFAAHIRDPDHVAAPAGIDDRRMGVYRQLFFNNLRNLLATMFPVLRKLHDDQRWAHLVRAFMRDHRAQTPYFLQLPREFLNYLANEYKPDGDYPFLAELAHYEYAELEASIAPETDDPDLLDEQGDLLDGIPVRTVASRVHAYRWPVHRISASYIPEEPSAEAVFLAVYRGRDDKVRFLELNPVTAQLVERLGDNAAGRPGVQLLRELAVDIGYVDIEGFIAHGRAIFTEMRDAGLVLGTRCSHEGAM